MPYGLLDGLWASAQSIAGAAARRTDPAFPSIDGESAALIHPIRHSRAKYALSSAGPSLIEAGTAAWKA
jgi:hypothetical protein